MNEMNLQEEICMEELNRKAIEQLERISKNIASIGETEDFTDVAIEALEKVYKYRWHDLRKNPNDLPEHNNKVNVLYRKRNTTGELKYGLDRIIGDYPAGWKGFQKGNRVVAWREIEPYE